jgi:hypothetical protein
MKKLFTLICLLGSLAAVAQTPTVAIDTFTIKIELPKGSGTNGAGVAYNPEFGYYYMPMAGNKSYPIYVYNKKWELVDEMDNLIDFRGIWYNPDTKKLEANAYNDSTIYTIKLNSAGIPIGVEKTAVTPPVSDDDKNTCWAYLPSEKSVMVYVDADTRVIFYDRTAGVRKRSALTDPAIPQDDINYATVLYSGMAGKEIALGDYMDNAFWLYNAKTGAQVETVLLPFHHPLMRDRFNIGWANGIIWIFNTDERTWYGFEYKRAKKVD